MRINDKKDIEEFNIISELKKDEYFKVCLEGGENVWPIPAFSKSTSEKVCCSLKFLENAIFFNWIQAENEFNVKRSSLSIDFIEIKDVNIFFSKRVNTSWAGMNVNLYNLDLILRLKSNDLRSTNLTGDSMNEKNKRNEGNESEERIYKLEVSGIKNINKIIDVLDTKGIEIVDKSNVLGIIKDKGIEEVYYYLEKNYNKIAKEFNLDNPRK